MSIVTDRKCVAELPPLWWGVGDGRNHHFLFSSMYMLCKTTAHHCTNSGDAYHLTTFSLLEKHSKYIMKLFVGEISGGGISTPVFELPSLIFGAVN